MADIFNDDQSNNDDTDLGFNDLVGDDRKYKDADALAKAYANVERHARTLEAENARIRAEKDVRDAENKQNRENEPEPPLTPDPAEATPKPNSSAPEKVDFRSQIKDEIRALDEERRAAQNTDLAAARMVELYGSEQGAIEAIRKRAGELNVSVDWLRDSASRSPEAFYATMGITKEQSHSTPNPSGGVRMPDNNAVRNFEYFDRLRKDNPKLYYSAATQREMMAQAKKLGGDFYKR